MNPNNQAHWIYHPKIRFMSGDDENAGFDGLNFDEIFLPKTAWETASALDGHIQDGKLHLRFCWD